MICGGVSSAYEHSVICGGVSSAYEHSVICGGCLVLMSIQ